MASASAYVRMNLLCPAVPLPIDPRPLHERDAIVGKGVGTHDSLGE